MPRCSERPGGYIETFQVFSQVEGKKTTERIGSLKYHLDANGCKLEADGCNIITANINQFLHLLHQDNVKKYYLSILSITTVKKIRHEGSTLYLKIYLSLFLREEN